MIAAFVRALLPLAFFAAPPAWAGGPKAKLKIAVTECTVVATDPNQTPTPPKPETSAACPTPRATKVLEELRQPLRGTFDACGFGYSISPGVYQVQATLTYRRDQRTVTYLGFTVADYDPDSESVRTHAVRESELKDARGRRLAKPPELPSCMNERVLPEAARAILAAYEWDDGPVFDAVIAFELTAIGSAR